MVEKSSNEGEKTFAIIIGLLAGVALIIIFLAFVRKVFGEHGNTYFFLFYLYIGISYIFIYTEKLFTDNIY